MGKNKTTITLDFDFLTESQRKIVLKEIEQMKCQKKLSYNICRLLSERILFKYSLFKEYEDVWDMLADKIAGKLSNKRIHKVEASDNKPSEETEDLSVSKEVLTGLRAFRKGGNPVKES